MTPQRGSGRVQKSINRVGGIKKSVRYQSARKQAYINPRASDQESFQTETIDEDDEDYEDYENYEDDGDEDAAMQDDDNDPKLKNMIKRFASMAGNIETMNQVAAASQWMTSMQCTYKDILKFKAFNSHAEKVGLSKVWPEIIMYRAIGQISTYFLAGQILRTGGQQNINTLDELEISVVGWVRLASEGRLSRMEAAAGIDDGEGQYSSNAERLKALLDKYKIKNRFKKWNYDRMKTLRYEIYKVVHELDGDKRRPMLPSGKSWWTYPLPLSFLINASRSSSIKTFSSCGRGSSVSVVPEERHSHRVS